MRRSVLIATALLLISTVSIAETIEVDRCVARKCHRNGRWDSVQITEDRFIVYIDANRCPGRDTYCPTSYAGFTAPDGTALETDGYTVGEKTRGTIKVYVPRQYKGLYVKGINGSDRDDFLALTDFEDFSSARQAVAQTEPVAAMETGEPAPPVETSLDGLFVLLSGAYENKDAALAASAYDEDAAYMGPRGDTLRGREAIRGKFAELFESAAENEESLSLTFDHVDRVVEGRLAYETGYYTLTRRGPGGELASRGKFVIVARFETGRGWRFAVDAYSPAP